MNKITGFFLVVLVVLAAVLIIRNNAHTNPDARVASFQACVDAGYPIMESYPRQCRDGEGRLHVEDIGNGPEKADLVRVTNILPNQVITNPLIITGEARGNWYFEASFPVLLRDADGNNVPLDPPYIMADGEWMTTEFVPFSATLTFTPPATDTGTFILMKDNPSGLPEHDDSLTIPVRFR